MLSVYFALSVFFEEDRLDTRGWWLRRDSSLTLRMTSKPTVLTV